MPGGSQRSLSVGIISLGCAKNLVDSQIMAGVMLTENITIATTPEEADVLLVNTCSFIHDAREESVAAILDACALRDEGRPRAVVVTGCLPQRYRQELADSLPEVDAFVGLDGLETIGAVIRNAAGGEHAAADITPTSHRLYEPRLPSLSLTGGPFAYLKIGEGCNHPCAFCAIPSIRGRHRSRPIDALVAETEQLLASGIREINLISQDTTSYGRDLEGADLPGVLGALGNIGGEFWIRILYGYPSEVTDAVLDAMGEVEQVLPYLDIPIQHSHPDILKAMRRAGTARAVKTLPARVRKRLPDATLRTTCLVGFPGEKREHFSHLLDHVREAKYDHLGAFAFSPEEGTAAETLTGRPRPETAERRRGKLLLAQQEIVAERVAQLVGSDDVALLESPGDERGSWLARTRRQAPDVDGITFVSGLANNAEAGDLVPVRYTGGADYDLFAELI
ncbi:MAG: 30S ribosomal protein S12 methylthiotransferase RimO [Kiritimatiellia bacterium]|nr:30S ribosomal protein S12 methylthiotransferase RimO [Kiritimatiellia bacterium]MDP6809963.1 30S ribosomal protein S12 methylthiotransferase RimO [Kiritimatiellia bacterium]